MFTELVACFHIYDLHFLLSCELCCPAGIKLYCLVIEAHVYEQLAQRVARWLTGRASDLRVIDTRFDSPSGRCRVKTLGKFLTPSCNVVLYSII